MTEKQTRRSWLASVGGAFTFGGLIAARASAKATSALPSRRPSPERGFVIDVPGAVIDGQDIRSHVIIKAPCLLAGCRIEGTIFVEADDVVVSNCLITKGGIQARAKRGRIIGNLFARDARSASMPRNLRLAGNTIIPVG